MISVEGLKVEFGVKPLFVDASFVINDRDRIALVGKNGAGKSTLMNVLSGIYPYGTYDGDIIYNGEICKFNKIKDSEEKGISEIIIAKQRSGPIGTVELLWMPEYTQFANLAH